METFDLNALKDKAKAEADALYISVKTHLSDSWDQVPEQVKEDIKWSALRMGELRLRALTGEDVSQEEAVVKAIMSDFKTTGLIKSAVLAEQLESKFWSGVEVMAETLSTFFLAGLRGSLKGISGGPI